jgi:gamma-glutamylcyclotransferase (GGCT)/AIG2-like uncharacterized protein YtfP
VAEAAGRVFVYGTLMPGELLWPALERFATGWAPATARGRLWDTGRGYPAIRFATGADAETDTDAAVVPGVLVTLDSERRAEAFAVLDGIEGEGVLYRRVEVDTSGGRATSYEWLGSTDGLVSLPEGWPRRE